MPHPSTDLPQINTSLKKPVLAGTIIVLVFVFGFILWASTAPLASAIIAAGQVKVDSNRKQIQHLNGGIVTEVLVIDGQKVKAGDTLVILDPVQAESSLGIVKGALDNAYLKRQRLHAERDGLVVPDFSKYQNNQYLTEAEKDNFDQLIAAQLSLFTIRQSVQKSQDEIINQQILNLNTQITGYISQQTSTQKQIQISYDELANLKELKKKGLVGNERVLELSRNLAQLEGRDGELLSLVAGSRSKIDEQRLELIRIKRSFNEAVLAELQELDDKIMDLAERTNAASHNLQQMVVVAPVDGTIVSLSVHTIGGVVVPGQLLMEIVPSNDRLIIEGQVTPADVDDVVIGLKARVKLSGLQQRTTPELQGVVKYVSADSMLDERSGQSYFLIRISVSSEELNKLTDDELVPGMPAEVFIKTGERTAVQYLMQPILDTIDRAWRET